MLKFLFMGDRHNIERPPYSRKDDFLESCRLKDEEIIQIAKDNKVTAILHPGDFWTDADKRPSNSFVTETVLKWIKCGIPVYGIAGNHDIVGANKESLSNTVCGMMDSLGFLNIIKDGEILEFTDGDITVGISGVNYHKNMDKAENVGDYIVTEKNTDYRIHMTHGMLTPHDFGTLYRHTKIDDIVSTKADLTLCGHDHFGFGLIEYDGKLFCNPGAVVRLNCSEKEMKRTVQVALITVDRTGIHVEMVPLKSARPADEVLTREGVEAETERQSYIDFIKDGVEKLNIGSGVNIIDVLEDIYTRDDIDENIRNSINKMIESKTISLKKRPEKPPTGTEIVKIQIENFQSHKNTEINLDTGFNVIIGESHQGKSAILRAIRWVAENKPAGKGIIRIGEKTAKVTIKLNNGTIIQRFASTSAAAKDNGYKIFMPDGTIQEGNTKMLPDVQRVMGWNSMYVGDNEELPLNHMRQGDSWYLIGDAYTGSDRARILGAIHNTDGADAAIKDFDKENSRIMDSIRGENVEIENQLAELAMRQEEKDDKVIIRDVLKRMIMIEKIREHQNSIRELDERVKMLDMIEKNFDERKILDRIAATKKSIEEKNAVAGWFRVIETETRRIAMADRTIDSMVNIDAAVSKVKEASANATRLSTICNLMRTASEASKKVAENTRIINGLDAIRSDVMDGLTNNIAVLKAARDRIDVIIKSSRSIAVADRFIQACGNIDEFDARRADMLAKMDRASKIQSWCEKKKDAEINQKKAEVYFDKAESHYQECINKKTELLKKNHVCPTCLSEIDDAAVDRIKEKMQQGDMQ